MNSKIKIILGIFFVFALLAPIYAGTLSKNATSMASSGPCSSGSKVSDIVKFKLVPINNVNQNDYSIILKFKKKVTIQELNISFINEDYPSQSVSITKDNIRPNINSLTIKNIDLSSLQDGNISVVVSFDNARCGVTKRNIKYTVAPYLKIYERYTSLKKKADFQIRGRIDRSSTLIVQTSLDGVKLSDNWVTCYISESPTMVSRFAEFTCDFNISLFEDSDKYKIKFIAQDDIGNIRAKDFNLKIYRAQK